MSELGIGDERMDEADIDAKTALDARIEPHLETEVEKMTRDPGVTRMSEEDIHAAEALPVVVVKNFSGKAGSEDLLNDLVQWVASLTENQVSRVAYLSLLPHSMIE
jgi:hypothetical protein